MPNHFHILVTPGEDTTLDKAVQLIKGGSSHDIHALRGHHMEIWQAGFHDWTIRDAKDYGAKVEYIRMNPVRARLVERPEEWAFSSASGKFLMDPAPAKFAPQASGARAR